ncbi:MAG: phosphoserine transaminase [Alphaproteobacteria bacterium]
MTDISTPAVRPADPRFSSGPCAKHPGWTPQSLETAWLGRSHRASGGKARLKSAIERTAKLLEIPPDYVVGILPASDTGAFEAMLWSLLGARGVAVLAWESFGNTWATDITKHLKLDAQVHLADYGDLPDLHAVDWARDVVFTWNGTTSGVRVPDGDWIAADRAGLTLCDATSAAFAQSLDWAKLDVTTLSWQKVLGGEAQHGMVVLSPRAVERLETYTPPWPLPKLFRLTKKGRLDRAIFAGSTINTPSMLCVEDFLRALDWAQKQGGLAGLMDRVAENFTVLEKWVEETPWIEFLANDPATRSNTSVTLRFCDPAITGLPAAGQADFAAAIARRLEENDAGYDTGSYRDAPPGLRIWCGATVEAENLRALLPWIAWAYACELEGITAPA